MGMLATQQENEAHAVEVRSQTAAFKWLASRIPGDTVWAALHALQVAADNRACEPFVRRSLNALASVSATASRHALSDAVGASTDAGAVLKVFGSPEVLSQAASANPLAAAQLRGIEAKLDLLAAEGGAVSAEEFGEMIGISRQSVSNRRAAGRLLAVEAGRRGYRYPVWQTRDGQTLPGLERVIEPLHNRDPWLRLAFMLGPNPGLGDRTPLDLLRAGDIERATAAADWFAGRAE